MKNKISKSPPKFLRDTANSSVVNFFNSLNTFNDLRKLIEEGESENQYLECKSPSSPQLDRALKSEFARHISGFSNSGGGVIIFGMRTDRHRDLDILTQIEPIGAIDDFTKRLKLSTPLLTEPPVMVSFKIIKEKPKDTKGIVLAYIPPTIGDPVRVKNSEFYLRIGDKTEIMPYEVIKRMFLGSNTPDLHIVFDQRLVKIQEDGKWEIPIILENTSSAPAEFVKVSVDFNNPEACQEIISSVFRDVSYVNPNRKIFMCDVRGLIYKGLNVVVGNFSVLMKKIKLPKRLLDITITLYAKNMRARYQRIKIYLDRKKFQIKELEKDYLY